MTIKFDYFKHEYDNTLPAFVEVDDKHILHRPTSRFLDWPALQARWQADGYVPQDGEVGPAPEWLWERFKIGSLITWPVFDIRDYNDVPQGLEGFMITGYGRVNDHDADTFLSGIFVDYSASIPSSTGGAVMLVVGQQTLGYVGPTGEQLQGTRETGPLTATLFDAAPNESKILAQWLLDLPVLAPGERLPAVPPVNLTLPVLTYDAELDELVYTAGVWQDPQPETLTMYLQASPGGPWNTPITPGTFAVEEAWRGKSVWASELANNAGGTSPAMADSPQVAIPAAVVLSYPWDNFTTHAQINDWADANGVACGTGWSSMTLAEKRAWLVKYYDGDRPWEQAQGA